MPGDNSRAEASHDPSHHPHYCGEIIIAGFVLNQLSLEKVEVESEMIMILEHSKDIIMAVWVGVVMRGLER